MVEDRHLRESEAVYGLHRIVFVAFGIALMAMIYVHSHRWQEDYYNPVLKLKQLQDDENNDQ